MTREEQKRIWHEMIERGCRLIPVSANKRPAIDSWNNDFPKEKRHQWVDNDTYFGFGIACGKDYYAIDIDADCDTLLPGYLEKLCSVRQDLAENCYIETSPHGAHVIFRCEENTLVGTPLAKRNGDPNKWDEKHQRFEPENDEVLLAESRAKGQQVITWPTDGYVRIYPETPDGLRLSQRLMYDLQPISQGDIDVICKIAESFHTYQAPAKAKRKATPELSPERKAELEVQRREEWRKGFFVCDPILYFGSEFTQEQYEELLKDSGWKYHHTDQEGRIFYQRPGKGPHETDHSGDLMQTVNEDGSLCWMFYVFTTNSNLPANHGLPAWKYLMYDRGYTTANDPKKIPSEDIRAWKEDWFEEQARARCCKSRWEALVENMENRRRIFH